MLTLLAIASADAASANAPIYCGNSSDQVALVTLTSRANNAAKIDFCSKGSTNIKCSSCFGKGSGFFPYVDRAPVTVGIGADVGFLLFAENSVHTSRTEGLYPNASGGWPRNYSLPKFPIQPFNPPSKNQLLLHSGEKCSDLGRHCNQDNNNCTNPTTGSKSCWWLKYDENWLCGAEAKCCVQDNMELWDDFNDGDTSFCDGADAPGDYGTNEYCCSGQCCKRITQSQNIFYKCGHQC